MIRETDAARIGERKARARRPGDEPPDLRLGGIRRPLPRDRHQQPAWVSLLGEANEVLSLREMEPDADDANKQRETDGPEQPVP